MVEPPDPLQGGELDIVKPPPRPAPPDHFRLVQPDDRLGQRIGLQPQLRPVAPNHRGHSIIDETRNFAEAWSTLDEPRRKALLDYWVYNVQIAVEPILGMKRANEKFAIVTLRTAPNDPRFFALDGQGARAAASSDLTHSSDSTDKREASAPLASAESTRPSTQAACPRTNGSGSESAEVSTGTASGDPQLPIPTQTLRANSARRARRMADPLENESHAASSKAISSNSINDGAAVPGGDAEEPGSGSTPNGNSPGPREAYAGSAAGLEKVRVNGHTSWEDCRLPRYVIPLPYGKRTKDKDGG